MRGREKGYGACSNKGVGVPSVVYDVENVALFAYYYYYYYYYCYYY